ncbi:CRN-like protein [Rhizophagus clarus]|uniref:CRN-like protein n=1 Tax=Rhizophagus clarus TaxID=94130 RepID=A0A8H3M959_9GLOM|nr:CRN-like protein [Rhizophagus clarus]
MSTITLSCLVAGENPYNNSSPVDIDTNKVKTVGHLKDAIKEKKQNDFTNVDADKLKLWKVNISFKESNEKLKLVNTKINVNIKEELGGVELLPLSRLANTFPLSQPTITYI